MKTRSDFFKGPGIKDLQNALLDDRDMDPSSTEKIGLNNLDKEIKNPMAE